MPNPRVAILRNRALHVAVDAHVRAHATPAHKIVIALDAPLEVETDGTSFEAGATWVAPNTSQAMGARGRVVALFVEPGTFGVGHGLGMAPIRRIGGRELERAREVAARIAEHDGSADEDAASELLSVLGFDVAPSLDARVARALDRIATDPDADIESIASDAGLSPSRLRHVVVGSTGLTLRTHRLWHRTLGAVERIAAGRELARVAADAGFSDHAHLTRSFVRFFGRVPSSLDEPMRVLAPYVDRAR